MNYVTEHLSPKGLFRKLEVKILTSNCVVRIQCEYAWQLLKTNFLPKRIRYLQKMEQRRHAKGSSAASHLCYHVSGFPPMPNVPPALLGYVPHKLLLQPCLQTNEQLLE